MTRIGAFTPEVAKEVLQVIRYLQQSGFRIPQPNDRREYEFQPEAPIYVRNDANEEIPAFGVMQTTGTVEVGGQNYIKVAKPSSSANGRYLFNGPVAIPSTTSDKCYGVAYSGPLVRTLTDGSAVTCGESWKAVNGQWYLEPGGDLLVAIGADDIGTNVIRGIANTKSGKPLYLRAPAAGVPPFNATTGQLGSASCEVMNLSSSGVYTASGNFLTVYNESGWIPSLSLIIAEYADSGVLVGRPPADIHYQYELRTNWYGGQALAYVKSMDGDSFGQTVLINNPLGEASYQKAGDKGEMIFQPGINKYYWIQSPCGTSNTPPAAATGACCITSSEGYSCIVSTEAGCDDVGGTYKGDGTDCETSSCP